MVCPCMSRKNDARNKWHYCYEFYIIIVDYITLLYFDDAYNLLTEHQ